MPALPVDGGFAAQWNAGCFSFGLTNRFTNPQGQVTLGDAYFKALPRLELDLSDMTPFDMRTVLSAANALRQNCYFKSIRFNKDLRDFLSLNETKREMKKLESGRYGRGESKKNLKASAAQAMKKHSGEEVLAKLFEGCAFYAIDLSGTHLGVSCVKKICSTLLRSVGGISPASFLAELNLSGIDLSKCDKKLSEVIQASIGPYRKIELKNCRLTSQHRDLFEAIGARSGEGLVHLDLCGNEIGPLGLTGQQHPLQNIWLSSKLQTVLLNNTQIDFHNMVVDFVLFNKNMNKPLPNLKRLEVDRTVWEDRSAVEAFLLR